MVHENRSFLLPRNRGEDQRLPSRELTMLALESGPIRCEFRRQSDRFQNSLLVRIDAQWVPVLQSIEGTADDLWPASPPWQQLVEERIGSNQQSVLLGVGLSGTAHWSIAVEPLCSGLGLHLDVACKSPKTPTFIGTTFRIEPTWTLLQSLNTPTELRIACTGIRQLLVLRAKHGAFHALGEDRASTIQLCPMPLETGVVTRRWAMEAMLEDNLPEMLIEKRSSL